MKKEIVLSVRNGAKKYDNQIVFSDMNLDIEARKVTVIYGESGCGKTTLLKCLALLEPLTKGDIFLDGQKVVSEGVIINEGLVRGKVGIVFQDFYLWENKKVINNLIEALIYVKRIPKVEAVARARKIAGDLHINKELLEKYPPELSRGERQRVAIARTLLMDPEIILLDEASSSLDEFLKHQLIKSLELLREKNKTIVIITHDKEFGGRVGDRLINFKEL